MRKKMNNYEMAAYCNRMADLCEERIAEMREEIERYKKLKKDYEEDAYLYLLRGQKAERLLRENA